MNVNGVGRTAPVAVPSPGESDRAPTQTAGTANPAKATAAERSRQEAREVEKLPPLKGLTVNEFRIILGAMPPRSPNAQGAETSGLDQYL
jgi:hypothetical protein